MPEATPPLRVGIAGLGNLGAGVARLLLAGLPGLVLAAVAGRDIARVTAALAALRPAADACAAPVGAGAASGPALAPRNPRPAPLAESAAVPHTLPADVRIVPLAELPGAVDVVVECLTPDAAPALVEATLAAGRSIVVASVTALLLEPGLQALAKAAGSPAARILVPTGAILGLDVIRAAALGRIDHVTVRTRKPPASLGGSAPLEQATCLFRGNALDAVRAYPRNVNVAAAVALAGIGGERTQVEIWSDPAVSRNTHEVELDSDTASVRMQVSNLPSPDNPKTSLITAQSIVAALQSLVVPVRVGS